MILLLYFQFVFCISQDPFPQLVVDQKGFLSAFQPKETVSEGAETFWQKLIFRPKGNFRQTWYILAKIPSFGRILWHIFGPKERYFGRNNLILAEIYFFRLPLVLSVTLGGFRLSAEIQAFKISSFGFSWNSFGWSLPTMPSNGEIWQNGINVWFKWIPLTAIVLLIAAGLLVPFP